MLRLKKTVIIYSLSFIFCLPWLFYTYSLTNIPFYWADSGSNTFYTMSTPYSGEYGDWKSNADLSLVPERKQFIDRISKLSVAEMDKEYQREALRNIKNHPLKYMYNWSANIGRLIFSYPFTNAKQTMKTYFTILPNIFVAVFIAIGIPLSYTEL